MNELQMAKQMSMTELERNLHQARREFNKTVNQLADTAIEDSSTYSEAIKKLKEFRWKFTGQSAPMMIDIAIEIVEKRALMAEIK